MFLHDLTPRPPAQDHAGTVVVAAVFLVGGAFNLLAAIIGLLRKGDMRTTIGRQLQSALGKKGAIALWFALGVLCTAAGLWFAVGVG
jgi:hypothetical protein